MNEYIITRIYDAGNKVCDRYTVVFAHESGPGLWECLCLSSDPDSPQGFSQFSSCQVGKHLGKEHF